MVNDGRCTTQSHRLNGRDWTQMFPIQKYIETLLEANPLGRE